jgi:hypothetical protein
MACLFIKIYWSESQTILKKYWRVFNCNFEDAISPLNNISPYVFTLTAWKTAIRTSQQILIFEVQKPVEVPT